MQSCNAPPGDPALIADIVNHIKSKGIFDVMRKGCLSDVDTKPAFQNLRQRVEGFSSNFLSKIEWRPDLNKNQLRDTLRTELNNSGMMAHGLDHLVDQVVHQKAAKSFLPQIREVVYDFLGLSKPEDKHITSGFPFNVPPPTVQQEEKRKVMEETPTSSETYKETVSVEQSKNDNELFDSICSGVQPVELKRENEIFNLNSNSSSSEIFITRTNMIYSDSDSSKDISNSVAAEKVDDSSKTTNKTTSSPHSTIDNVNNSPKKHLETDKIEKDDKSFKRTNFIGSLGHIESDSDKADETSNDAFKTSKSLGSKQFATETSKSSKKIGSKSNTVETKSLENPAKTVKSSSESKSVFGVKSKSKSKKDLGHADKNKSKSSQKHTHSSKTHDSESNKHSKSSFSKSAHSSNKLDSMREKESSKSSGSPKKSEKKKKSKHSIRKDDGSKPHRNKAVISHCSDSEDNMSFDKPTFCEIENFSIFKNNMTSDVKDGMPHSCSISTSEISGYTSPTEVYHKRKLETSKESAKKKRKISSDVNIKEDSVNYSEENTNETAKKSCKRQRKLNPKYASNDFSSIFNKKQRRLEDKSQKVVTNRHKSLSVSSTNSDFKHGSSENISSSDESSENSRSEKCTRESSASSDSESSRGASSEKEIPSNESTSEPKFTLSKSGSSHNSSQRYDSSDLYKPRSVNQSTSRRSR